MGATYELRLSDESSSENTDGSSSRSSGSDALIERVIEVTPEGMVLEYDLASDEGLPHGRQDQWQYPFRVFKRHDGATRILNVAEMEARISQWLEHSEIPRSACGTWVFTWNAFRIDCDPQSVLEALAKFDMRPEQVREGLLFQEPGASSAAPIRLEESGAEYSTYVVELAVDPAWVRREKAEADVVVGEIMRDSITFDEALRERSGQDISGTITLTFLTNAEGEVFRRIKVTKLDIRNPVGVVETSTDTETLERKPLAERL